MTFFVDANIIIYSAGQSPYADPCGDLLEAIAQGQTDGRTSTAVLEEVWHQELSGRLTNLNGLTRQSFIAFTPLLPVTDEAFHAALSLPAEPNLGTNDRLHVGTCQAHGIDVIVSADSDFDRVRSIHRVDPLDRSAMRRLLA